MIRVKSTEIKNLPRELTIDEFEDISRILNDVSILEIEKYSRVFGYLGADRKDLNDLGFKEFGDLVKEFNEIAEIKRGMTQKIEIGGYIYKSYEDGEDFKLMVRDMAIIERIVSESPERHLAEIVAVLFKREDLTASEHYDKTHVKHKAKLIREEGIDAELAMPFIVIVTSQLAEATNSALLARANELVEE